MEQYWKMGDFVFDITKVSYISPYNKESGSLSLGIDGQCVNIQVNENTYIKFIDRFVREFPIKIIT
jgi:hypothetical protein